MADSLPHSKDELILKIQERVRAAINEGYQYVGPVNESEDYLRENVFSRIYMIILYIDMVGSTRMVLDFPIKEVAAIFSSFSQEMAYVIKQFGGYVLKFSGDAVIGYFVAKNDIDESINRAVHCAKSMMAAIKYGINPVLAEFGHHSLEIKIGIDYGEVAVVRYGENKKESHVDLIGPSMNIASKIQGIAKPDQLLIGADVFTRLYSEHKKYFEKLHMTQDQWNFKSRKSRQIYPVYRYVGE